MRQFAVQRTFIEPANEIPVQAERAGIDFNQLLMLAL